MLYLLKNEDIDCVGTKSEEKFPQPNLMTLLFIIMMILRIISVRYPILLNGLHLWLIIMELFYPVSAL